ncbi:PREDICTED: uncharacterized protein LOC109155870 [Ipomoea nil]|uniref:uncharacterized protein LOC109155870 n=1 Tax=Ipomoea nil TaxID=35883 RepID=UPI000901ECC0|nr:PREDICTED: uncharacterized protein LOC109155870 [Ipomoea nil]
MNGLVAAYKFKNIDLLSIPTPHFPTFHCTFSHFLQQNRNCVLIEKTEISKNMKKTSLTAASMAAVSAAALSSASSKAHTFHTNDDGTGKKNGKSSSTAAVPPRSDKFAPRFDGLRFIETLVTAHR